MFKKIKISAFTALVLLVLFPNQQSLCMDDVTEEKVAPKKNLSQKEDCLSSLNSLNNMKIHNEEDLSNCNQQLELIYKKLSALVEINLDLQTKNLKKKNKIKELKKETKALYALTATGQSFTEDKVNLSKVPQSFAEWWQELSSRTEPWIQRLLQKYSSYDNLSLDICDIHIRAEGARALFRCDLSLITTMDLKNCFIEDAGVKAIVSSNLVLLKSLNLTKNYIRDAGANILGSRSWPYLMYLYLQENYISCQGVPYLLSNNLPFLENLNLISNFIQDDGGKSIVLCEKPFLKRVHLLGNQISQEVKMLPRKRKLDIQF